MPENGLSERDVCTKLITPAIEKAGWDVQTQVREEVTLTGYVAHGGSLRTGRDVHESLDIAVEQAQFDAPRNRAFEQGDHAADQLRQVHRLDDEAAADGVALADAETVTASSVFGCGAVPVDDVVVGYA